MRLICPNCGAQYDVPTEVIPAEGRDVQCSNCGHTWYQNHPDQDAELAEDLGQPLPDPEWTPEPEDMPQPPADPALEDDIYDEPAETYAEEDIPPAPKPRGLDPEVANILAEEREFEARQRAAETLESQPDLGLDDPDEDEQARRSRQARERMARLRGAEAPAPVATSERPAIPTEPAVAYDDYEDDDDYVAPSAAAAAAAASSRRDLLPDVEEINQTLRASNDPRGSERPENVETDLPHRSGGFGKGFALIVVLALIALCAYVMAPAIIDALPQLSPALTAYVDIIDQGRDWLDGQMTTLMQMLDSMTSEAAQDPAPSE
ncbi:zinc-ribbon domain-containing protein [Sagittula sp. SSi028]|uniref:zinc-ribbon domain-containing protein n=1 Tax=Sagittula sp. SSi028 TaxID=3400636 RepID=UPI003AF4C5B2